MPTKLTCLKVFIASPGGLAEERKAFKDEIADLNEIDAIPRGKYLHALGWEDTLGGVGRPQSIINEDVQKSDFCIVMLWDRWGSPPDSKTSKYTSGTEEEYHVAMECHEKGTMRQMVLMFKAIEARQLSDPGPELQKVLEFKKQLEESKKHLFLTFDTTDSFRKLLRKHLAAWVRDDETRRSTEILPAPPRPPAGGLKTGMESTDLAREDLMLRAEDSATAKAWKLANEGHLTDAEVEFARNSVGSQKPSAFIEYGRFLRRGGRLDQASAMFHGALDVARNQRDQPGMAAAYGNLGDVLKTRGNLDSAEQMYRKSLEIDERLGHLEGMAAAYGNLGDVLKTRGNLDSAEQMYRKSLAAAERLGSVPLIRQVQSLLEKIKE